jgi:hypothetical protein
MSLTLYCFLSSDMSIEGIFRKNGNIRRLKELTDALDRDQSTVNLQEDNPVQLAALLKKFLRDLPDPLCTFKLHQLIIATQRGCLFHQTSYSSYFVLKCFGAFRCRATGTAKESASPRLLSASQATSGHSRSPFRLSQMGRFILARR